MSDVRTSLTRDTVSATTVVEATPEAVFDFLRRPANHAAVSGDQTVKGTVKGPDALSLDDRFGMSMRMGVPYRMTSKVVEFEQDRRIAWCHMAGHRWRWEIEPEEDGRSKVTETFDLSTARLPFALRLVGYPKGHEKNVTASVANVAAHFAGAPAPG
jgi:uncharacterized protein YndB with AHSA1/START domain